MTANVNLNSQMKALSLKSNNHISSRVEAVSSQTVEKKTRESLKKAPPAETPLAEFLSKINEVTIRIIGYSFSLFLREAGTAKVLELLIKWERSKDPLSAYIKPLLSDSEEYAAAVQQAWCNELILNSFTRPNNHQFNKDNYFFLASNIAEKIKPLKYLSWSLEILFKSNVLLNGLNISSPNSWKKFLTLLYATSQHKSVENLYIKASDTHYPCCKIPPDNLIFGLMSAIKDPFIVDRRKPHEELRKGKASLILNNNSLDSFHMRVLGKALNKNISKLIIKYNLIKEEGVNYLAEGLQNTSITILALDKVADGDTWFLALKDKLPPTLQALSLESNGIGNQGFKNLEEILTLNIKNISLAGNKLTSWNAEIRKHQTEMLNNILELIKNKNIRALSLSNNNFVKNDFKYLLKDISETEMIYFDFYGNRETEEKTDYRVNAKGERMKIQRGPKDAYKKLYIFDSTRNE